jgi:hypothetical protein
MMERETAVVPRAPQRAGLLSKRSCGTASNRTGMCWRCGLGTAALSCATACRTSYPQNSSVPSPDPTDAWRCRDGPAWFGGSGSGPGCCEAFLSVVALLCVCVLCCVQTAGCCVARVCVVYVGVGVCKSEGGLQLFPGECVWVRPLGRRAQFLEGNYNHESTAGPWERQNCRFSTQWARCWARSPACGVPGGGRDVHLISQLKVWARHTTAGVATANKQGES